MKLKQNIKFTNKGFTLIEILGAITILGIISFFAVTNILKITKRAETEYYSKLEKNIQLSSQTYSQNNRAELPKNVGEKVTIPLKNIVDKNYIDNIKDYHDGDCDLNKSYVKIFKYTKTKYTYSTVLVCDNYKNNEVENLSTPSIDIKFGRAKNDSSAVISIDAAHINTKENPIYIYNYNIVIKRNGNIVYSTGNVLGEKNKTINKEISINKYTPGKITVEVKAINSLGNIDSKSLSAEYEDTEKPECIIADADKNRNVWSKGSRTITVKCKDTGIGCEREEYTKNFKNDAKTGYITIKDKAGNSTKCNVNVYIDNTPPTINDPVNTSNNDWTNKAVTISATANDNISAIAKVYYGYDENSVIETTDISIENNKISKTWDLETNTNVYYKVEDEAGNVSSVANVGKIKIDKTPPVINSVYNDSKGKWTAGPVKITASATDNSSGIKNYIYGYSSDSIDKTDVTTTENNMSGSWSGARNDVVYLKVYDNAGNVSDYKSAGYVKIDTTKPTIKGSIDCSVCGKCTTNITATENESGISKWQWKYNNDNWKDINSTSSSYIDTWGGKGKTAYVRVINNVGLVSKTYSAQINFKSCYHCNYSGGTLSGSICIRGAVTDSYQTCEDVYDCYRHGSNCRPGCYNGSNWGACCTNNCGTTWECTWHSYYTCPSGWSHYSGSGSSMRCYKAADTN